MLLVLLLNSRCALLCDHCFHVEFNATSLIIDCQLQGSLSLTQLINSIKLLSEPVEVIEISYCRHLYLSAMFLASCADFGITSVMIKYTQISEVLVNENTVTRIRQLSIIGCTVVTGDLSDLFIRNSYYELTYLNLTDNGITSFPYVNNMINLRTLDLSFNALSNLELSANALPLNLEKLYVTNNHIETVNLEATSLVNLQIIDLSYNNISTTCDIVLCPAKTPDLDRRTRVESIGDNSTDNVTCSDCFNRIDCIESLQLLNLSHNLITDLEEIVIWSDDFGRLDLTGNNLSCTSCPPNHTMEYLHYQYKTTLPKCSEPAQYYNMDIFTYLHVVCNMDEATSEEEKLTGKNDGRHVVFGKTGCPVTYLEFLN